MKKIFYLILFIIILLPFGVSAYTYHVDDFFVDLDDKEWIVLTRDNLMDKKIFLDIIGLSYDELKNNMKINNIYIDACKQCGSDNGNDLELFVIKKNISDVYNIYNYKENELYKIGNELKNKIGAHFFEIVSTNNVIFFHFKIYDSISNYNIEEYYTVANGNGYTILTKKINPFSTLEEDEIYKIVKTVKINYDSKYDKKSSNTNNSNIWFRAFTSSIVAGILGFLVALYSKKKQKNK